MSEQEAQQLLNNLDIFIHERDYSAKQRLAIIQGMLGIQECEPY